MHRRSVLGFLSVPVAVSLIPATAHAASGSLRLADHLIPAAGSPGLRTPRLATTPYRQVAVTWTGDLGDLGAVEVRTREERGWSAWRPLAPLEDLPDDEGNGLRGSELLWVGRSDGVQVRAAGPVPRDLGLVLIDPGVVPGDKDPAALATEREALTGGAPRPAMFSRADWGADEDWRNSPPRYCNTIRQVHVHHTAGSNGYTRADVPAIIRGMYRYHTHTLGWSDIGYNFLVDRFGRTWIGRAGGARRPVRGAHTLGFNYNSVGVAVMGNFETRWPSSVSVDAVVRLAAWKLDLYGRQPATRIWVPSEGSDLYPDGRSAHLWTIDGHRDTNQTACPGTYLYRQLPAIRDRAQRRVDAY